MKPAPFEYKVPRSIDEALDSLRLHGDSARLLAGGQSLVPAMNFRVVQPAVLVDLNRVPDLAYIRQENDKLHIGAMARERQLEFEAAIHAHSPLLAEAVPNIAHPQIRNRGTLGGSLANADPAAELPVIMLALEARLKVQKAGAQRWVEARDFFSGMFTTALQADEMLVEVELPPMPDRTGWSFMEVAPRAGDYALMGIAALVTRDEDGRCTRAKLVYLNAGDGPVEATAAEAELSGERLTEKMINSAAETASQDEIAPFGNVHASPDFQRHLAQVLTVRSLAAAAARAEARKS